MQRREQKLATRRRLLEAARNTFERKGFEETGLRDIARAAGVAAGTIFVHFRDKKDLLHAALFEDLQATLRKALEAPSEPSLERWLEHLTDSALSYYEARPELSRVLLKESLLADPPWAERFSAQMAEMHAGVAARTRLALSEGEYEDGLDPDVFAAAFLSFYLFGLLAWAQNSHPSPRAFVAHLAAQHLHPYQTTRPVT